MMKNKNKLSIYIPKNTEILEVICKSKDGSILEKKVYAQEILEQELKNEKFISKLP